MFVDFHSHILPGADHGSQNIRTSLAQLRHAAAAGVDTIVEIGPGKVLSGFVRKTVPELKTYAIDTAADLIAAIDALKGAN